MILDFKFWILDYLYSLYGHVISHDEELEDEKEKMKLSFFKIDNDLYKIKYNKVIIGL